MFKKTFGMNKMTTVRLKLRDVVYCVTLFLLTSLTIPAFVMSIYALAKVNDPTPTLMSPPPPTPPPSPFFTMIPADPMYCDPWCLDGHEGEQCVDDGVLYSCGAVEPKSCNVDKCQPKNWMCVSRYNKPCMSSNPDYECFTRACLTPLIER